MSETLDGCDWWNACHVANLLFSTNIEKVFFSGHQITLNKRGKNADCKKKSGSATYDWPIVILVPQPSNHNHLISPSYDQSLELSSLLLHGQIVFARFSFSFFFLCLTNLHIHFNRSKLFDLLTLRCSPWTYSNIERLHKTKT